MRVGATTITELPRLLLQDPAAVQLNKQFINTMEALEMRFLNRNRQVRGIAISSSLLSQQVSGAALFSVHLFLNAITTTPSHVNLDELVLFNMLLLYQQYHTDSNAVLLNFTA